MQVIQPEHGFSYPSIDQQVLQFEYYQHYTRAWVQNQLVRNNPRTVHEALRLVQQLTLHIEHQSRRAYRVDLETEQSLRSTLAQQRSVAVTCLTNTPTAAKGASLS